MRVQEQINSKNLPYVSGLMSWASCLKSIVLILWLVACGLWLVGCGYTTRSMISDKFKTIYVAPFINKIDITKETDTAHRYKIYRPTLETDITKSVIDRFLFDGNLRPIR